MRIGAFLWAVGVLAVMKASCDAANSVLHQTIAEGNVLGFPFSHEHMITAKDRLRLIDEWIDNGAPE